MSRHLRALASAPLLFLVVLIVASLPELVAVRRGSLTLMVDEPVQRIVRYLQDLPAGGVFVYRAGRMEREFFSDLPDYLRTSFVFATVGTAVGLIIGSALGFHTALTQRKRAFDVLVFLGNIPDFLFIVLAQLAVIGITSVTGIRIARVGSSGVTRQATLLPIIALSLYPMVATMRVVRARVETIRTREYLVGARARGLPQATILWRHVFAGVYPILQVEIGRVFALTLGSLFIAERLFNLTGLTRWLFNYAFVLPTSSRLGFYQYPHVVNCLVALMAVYLVGLAVLQVLLTIARRLLVHE
jgi:ABC-type dipeptide/oligopeptide/nickel transport system permease component